MSVKVRNLTQTRAGGIHIRLEPGGNVNLEEAYFGFEITWLGKVQQVDVIADRYRANYSDGDRLTEWRVTLRGGYSSVLTDAARRAADEEIEPIVLAWLDSSDYRQARQRAYAQVIARSISEERYDAARARRVLELHRHELSFADQTRLSAACDALGQLLDLLKEVDA